MKTAWNIPVNGYNRTVTIAIQNSMVSCHSQKLPEWRTRNNIIIKIENKNVTAYLPIEVIPLVIFLDVRSLVE